MSAATDAARLRTAPTPTHTRRVSKGATVVKWVTTTDHKVIGNLYFITSFIWFLLAGIMALVIRAELFSPGLQVVDTPDQYNQMFTMHGTIMLLLFATPLFAGFANALMPPTHHSPTTPTAPASVATCGSSAWPWVVSAPSSVRSTSSRRSSPCAHRA